MASGKLFKDFIVHSESETCPYLPDRQALMPLCVPSKAISLEEADKRLAAGQRRSGEFVYQTECPGCNACQPIRVLVSDFKFSASQRRALRKGDGELDLRTGAIVVDQRRVDLFNRHRRLRGLERPGSSIDVDEYHWGFGRSCFESFEMCYSLDGRIVAVAICDTGRSSLSAVYTYYDPEISHLSPGTYSILKQIEYCQANEMEFLYLGFYIAESPHMSYKSRFTPNQRLIQGQWELFE